jgi:hypothetical protein
MGAIGMSWGWLLLLVCSVLSGARVCAVTGDERTKGEPMSTRQNAEAKPPDSQTDFDFIIGSWKVRNRRLKQRLKGSDSWEEFEGRAVARKIWGGAANIDEYDAESPSGRIHGMTLRLYNPKSQQWSIYWANRANGVLDTPMIGGFRDGRGEFYDQEMFEGRSIYVRFIWSNITADSARWEQAFSPDGGKNWETNWIMEFTRASEISAPGPVQPRK